MKTYILNDAEIDERAIVSAENRIEAAGLINAVLAKRGRPLIHDSRLDEWVVDHEHAVVFLEAVK